MILERNRNSAFVEARLAKNRKVIEIFTKERLNVLTDLKVANGPSKKQDDKKITEELAQHLDLYNFYDTKTKTQKRHFVEIEDQIKAVKKRVQHLQSKQITDRQHQDRVWLAIKTLEALENKLEVQVKKFCVICAKNQRLREEIDHLLKERVNFMKMFDKMITQLSNGKKYMLDLIEQATIAYDQREEWCVKLHALRLKAHNDLIHNTQEVRECVRKDDNHKKLEEFLSVKCQKRLMKDLEMKEKLKREGNRLRLEEKLDFYKRLLDEIFNFTKETRLHSIATQFYHQEELNFSLFKHSNNLIGEMESVNDELGDLYFQIEAKRATHENREFQQTERLNNLEIELSETIETRKNTENELQELENYFREMASGIENLFKICRCDNDPLLKLLGKNRSIQFYNALFYCEILEKKVHELLLKAHFKDKILVLVLLFKWMF